MTSYKMTVDDFLRAKTILDGNDAPGPVRPIVLTKEQAQKFGYDIDLLPPHIVISETLYG